MDAFIERQIASFGGRRFARPDELDMRKYPNFVRIRIRDNRMQADPVEPRNSILGREVFLFRVVAAMLAQCRVADTTLIVSMADAYYAGEEVPTFSFGVPDGKPGLIFANFDLHDFAVAGKKRDFDEVKALCAAHRPPKKHVAADMYFKGGRTSAGRTRIRESLAREKRPLRVVASDDCAEEVYRIKNHKYALDLCGWFPQSLRLKYLFMMSRLVVRVSFFDPARGETSFMRQYYDYLYRENEDYVHLVYQLDYKKPLPAELYRKIVGDLLQTYDHFEARPAEYAAVVARMDAKRAQMSLRSANEYLAAVINAYTARLLEPAT